MFRKLVSFLYFTVEYLLLSFILYFATMHKKENVSVKAAPFDTVLGVTDGGCKVYSCDYDTIDRSKFPTRESMQMVYNGVYTGYRYQCVELARRYLLINHGVVFDSIPMAYDIFNLRTVKRVSDNELFSMAPHKNGEKILPVKGSMLIWKPMGFFKVTGHVAIIVNVQRGHIEVVEQNVEDAIWPQGQTYSRRLKAETKSTGEYIISPSYDDSEVLGWMNIDYSSPVSKDAEYQCTNKALNKHIFEVQSCDAPIDWVDKNHPAVKVWTEMHGDRLVEEGGKTAKYFTLTKPGHLGITHATEELHKLFLNATEQVIYNEELYSSKFDIPKKLFEKIRRSWFHHHSDTVSGRFDFALTSNGVKVYEYNADSASCLFECGYIQNRWANAIGIGNVGQDSNPRLFDDLVATWKKQDVNGVLHLLCDNDVEETYHTLYMKSAAEAAGITCKLVKGFDGISWNKDGGIVDEEGVVIKTVWKTWSWQTALAQLTEDELKDYLNHDDNVKNHILKQDTTKKPRLVDILLNDDVRVFEPLWTLITSSKAILPVLWKLYPNHPLLLNSSFELTPELKKAGYASKPIFGRTGKNVSIVTAGGDLLEKTDGRWDKSPNVYQELSLLPDYDGEKVQVCTFAINGKYGGSVLRVDKSNIIGLESEVYCLRIVSEE